MIVDINLLPRIEKESKLMPLLIGFLLIIWFAFAGLQIYLYIQEQKVITAYEQRIMDIERKKELVQAQLNNIHAAEASMETVIDPVQVIRMIYDMRIDAGMILDQLNGLLGTGGALTNIVYNNSEQISLVTHFQNMEDASHFLFNLRQLPFVSHGMLNSIAKEITMVDTTSVDPEGEDETIHQVENSTYVSTFSITLNREKREVADGDQGN